MSSKLPAKVFVRWTDIGPNDEPYLQCSEDMSELADEVGGKWSVGMYELSSTGKLATRTEFEADKRAKR